MSSKNVHQIVVLFFWIAASCSAFLTAPPENSLLTTPAPLINLSLPVIGNEPSFLNDSLRKCNGAQYGTNLNYDSCLDAFRTFQLGAHPGDVLVGKRGIGEGNFAIWLPYRLISGRKGTAEYDTSSGTELSRAMWKLINQCVRDEGGQGGVASNIGEHKTLGIILRSYNPSQVQCSRQADQHYGFDECHVLLDHVPAAVAPLKTWGRLGDPGVDVGLPTMEAAAAPQNCRFCVRAYGTDPSVRDQMTRFDAWQAAVALKGMCARFSKRGEFVQMGRNKRLYMTIDDYRGGSSLDQAPPVPRPPHHSTQGLTLGEEWDWEWQPDRDASDAR
ncbi:MAG: hypothetical protein Q9212_007287 [Teloschistes hypoglaucus]